MTSTAPALASPHEKAVVRFDRLLLLYAVVPLCVVVAMLDVFVLRRAIADRLPDHPDKLVYFTLLFNFPHIVASHLLFLDGAYVRAYWKVALLGLAGLAAITTVCVLIGSVAVFLFAMVVTHFHIIGQQVGLTGAQLRTTDWSFTAWRWLSQLTAGLILLSVLEQVGPFRTPLAIASVVLLIPSTLVAARLSGRAATPSAKRYLWANQAMFYAMAICQWLSYPILTVLMPRIVHDVSAFYVYGVHDTNHNRGTHRPNLLYRVTGSVGLPPALVGPLVAIGLAYAVDRLLAETLRLHVVYWVSGLHYYLEAIVWKTGTPHRRSVSFR